MVPSMYSLMWEAELVIERSPNALKPHFEATMRRSAGIEYLDDWRPTEYFVPNVVLSDKLPQKFFIHTGLIDNLRKS